MSVSRHVQEVVDKLGYIAYKQLLAVIPVGTWYSGY